MNLDSVNAELFPDLILVEGIGAARALYYNGQMVDINQSLAVFRHSPTGFNWGYHGSGASQTALAVLLEACKDAQQALYLYQQFKRTFIAVLPGSFKMTVKLKDWVMAIKHELDTKDQLLEFAEIKDLEFEKIRVKSVGSMNTTFEL